MRKIKFRAWDMKNKLMWDVESIDGMDTGMASMTVNLGSLNHQKVTDCLKCPYGDCYAPFYYVKDRIILMQFTGLVDKSGKEIYEGDIVRYWHTYQKKWGAPAVVSFDTYHTGRDEAITGWITVDCVLDTYYHDVEVIGNIYQAPELLEVK